MANVLESTKSFIQKNANVIQVPTVNQHQHMIFMSSLLQTYLNKVGITPTNVNFHLSDCFVTSLKHQR